MSKVLQFLGIGKKPESQGLQMLQTAQNQDRQDAFGGNLNASQTNVVTTKTTVQMSQVVSQTLPKERPNLMAVGNQATRQQIETFSVPKNPGMAAQSQRIYTNSENSIQYPVASNAPNIAASQSTRGLTAIEVYSNPVKPIEYDEIRTKLTNFVERTFPSPFPSRLSNPDDFDNDLVSQSFPSTHVEFLLENSKYSDKSKENQRTKFLNYKKEIEFCKRYINMNEVKKQKLLQEIEDYKRRQGGFTPSSPNEPEFRNLSNQLRDQDRLVEQERKDLALLRQQLQAAGGDLEQFGGYTPGHPYQNEAEQYHEESPTSQFNPNAFSKKVNAVNPSDNQHYQPESDYNIANNHDYNSPQNHNESNNWGNQGQGQTGHYDNQSNQYVTPQSQGQHGHNQFAFDDNQRQSQSRPDQLANQSYNNGYGNAFADGNYSHHYNDPQVQQDPNFISGAKGSNQRPNQYSQPQPSVAQNYGAPQQYDYNQPQQHSQRQDIHSYNNDDFDPLADHQSPPTHRQQYPPTQPAQPSSNKPQMSGQPKKNNPLMKKL